MTTPFANGTVIKAADQLPATWRGGTTRAIFAFPPETLNSSAAAQLWIGTATIERDGPYSLFADRTRIHLPIRGNGLRLHFQEPTATIALESFAQATFAGDRPLMVTLFDGVVEAFNLIFHPTVQAEVQVHHLTPSDDNFVLEPSAPNAKTPSVATQILYLVDGLCTVERAGEALTQLSPGDAYICGAEDVTRIGCRHSDVTLIRAICLF